MQETSAIIERWLAFAAVSGFVLVLGLVAMGWRSRNHPALRRLTMVAGVLAVLGALTVVIIVPTLLIVSSH